MISTRFRISYMAKNEHEYDMEKKNNRFQVMSKCVESFSIKLKS